MMIFAKHFFLSFLKTINNRFIFAFLTLISAGNMMKAKECSIPKQNSRFMAEKDALPIKTLKTLTPRAIIAVVICYAKKPLVSTQNTMINGIRFVRLALPKENTPKNMAAMC